MDTKTILCPCGDAALTAKPLGTQGSHKKYADCCGRYLDGGETALTAEVLMRSRYTAYTPAVKIIYWRPGIAAHAPLHLN